MTLNFRQLLTVLTLAALSVVPACSNDSSNKEATTSEMAGTANNGGGRSDDYPLKNWMKSNAATALQSQSFSKLNAVFTEMATLSPPVTDLQSSWRNIAKAGEKSASAHDLEGVRAACKSCHDEHRATYRARFRSRPLPESR